MSHSVATMLSAGFVLLATATTSAVEPRAYWRFEGAGGSTVIDSGPLGLDGALNGLPVRIAAVAVDPAAGLDALDDEATVVVARDDVDAEGTWKWKGKVSFNSVSRPLSPFASLVFLRATRVPR